MDGKNQGISFQNQGTIFDFQKLQVRLLPQHPIPFTLFACLLLYLKFLILTSCKVITKAQLYSTKPELRFLSGSNSARGVLQVRDHEDL